LQNDLFGTPKDKKYFYMIHTLYQTCNTSYHGQKRCASAACRDTDHAAGATTRSIVDAQIEANNKLEARIQSIVAAVKDNVMAIDITSDE
jgi:hypothetical protein